MITNTVVGNLTDWLLANEPDVYWRWWSEAGWYADYASADLEISCEQWLSNQYPKVLQNWQIVRFK